MIILNDQPYAHDEVPAMAWNRSFRYGDGLFETIRVYKGVAILLEAHFERLFRGMLALGYRFDPDHWKFRIRQAIHTYLQRQELTGPARLRLHVWREGGGTYRPVTDSASYLLEGAILEKEYFREPEPITVSDFRGFSVVAAGISGFKTASALPYVIAARQARDAGTDEAFLFDPKGRIVEASAANVFQVKGTTFITPPLSSGCLDGIMRRQVLAMLEHLPYTLVERSLRPDELRKADAIFLTNTVRGIQPVCAYRDRCWKEENWQQVIFLQKSWLNLVESLT